MRRLLGIFVISALYLVFVFHLVNIYFARQQAFEQFLLVDGGVYPLLFWGGYVVAGSVVPLVLLWTPRFAGARATFFAALLVILGAFAWLYTFIIGGQAFPLEIFPGYAASSSFGDGQIQSYVPSLPEIALGVGGLGLAFLITLAGVRALPFVPHDDSTAPEGAGAD